MQHTYKMDLYLFDAYGPDPYKRRFTRYFDDETVNKILVPIILQIVWFIYKYHNTY